MLKSFVPLHAKSDYSFGQAVGSPAELAQAAQALGARAMALTDAGTLAGQVQFHEACRACGIKAITGAELPIASGAARHSGERLVFLVREARGYANLCHLLSEPERLSLAPERLAGLFALTDDPVTAEALVTAQIERATLGLLLVRPSASPSRESALRRAAATLGLSLIADLDVTMPGPEDAAFHALRAEIHDRARRAGPRSRPAPRALSQAAEALFADVPEAIRETRRIADACEFDLLERQARPFVPVGLSAESAARSLTERCRRGAHVTARHEQRLERELGVIRELGLSGYFLAIAAIGDEAKRRQIPLMARGSAVSSLVVMRLGLSTIDPLAHGLYFERFIRASRREPPDIDLDVSSARREELVRWTEERFGRSRVCAVASYQKFQRRAAYRDALAALGVTPNEVARFAWALPDDELPLPAPIELLPSRISRSARLIERLIGRPRHLSTHPSALVVSASPLLEATPPVRAPKGRLVTQYDGESLARLGFLKVDLLGNRAMSELEEVAHWTSSALLDFPADDAKTLATIGRADTIACHQLESPAMRSLLERMPVSSLADVMTSIALIRPGAGAGSAKAAFVRRARGEERPRFPDPRLKEALTDTHGLLLYEEDVIRVIQAVTGASAEESDEIRAAVVRGEDAFAEFAGRAAKNGFEPTAIDAVWANIARFAAYSFSKAHAASVAELAYQSAFAKTHHTKAFACAVLNHHGGLYPLRTVAAALVRDGVTFRAPDVNASELPCTVEQDAVRLGLDRIKYLTRPTKRLLLEGRSRQGPFLSLSDLKARIPCTARELEALVLSGACDALAPLTKEDYPFPHQAVLNVERAAVRVRPFARPERIELYRLLVRAWNELRFLEMHPSNHPMALLRDEATRAGCLRTSELRDHAGELVRFAGIVAALRRVPVPGGSVLEFVTLEDEQGLVESIVPPLRYGRLDDPIRNPGPYLVEGSVAVDGRHVQLEIHSVTPFHRRGRPYAA